MLNDHNTASPCSCCRDGRGTAECWHNAYELGRKAAADEIEGNVEGDVYRYFDREEHAPGCECADCGMQQALRHEMATRVLDAATVARMMMEPYRVAIENPDARVSLKILIAEAERRSGD